MTEVRIGVLGAGRIAQSAHLPAITKSPRAHLVGVFDPSVVLRDDVARRYGVRSFATVESMLTDADVDAVVVAVPDRLHHSLALAAIAAGKHVLVEKPLAATLSDCDEVVAAADASGLVVQVGAMKRHDPGVRVAAHAVRERIGRVLSATLWYRVMAALRPGTEATFFPPMVVDPDVRATEAAFKADRGAYLLVTHGAHVFDGMRMMFGEPAEMSVRRSNHGDDFTWHGMATGADGGLIHFEITPNAHAPYAEGAAIYGEHGSVQLRTPFPVTMQASAVDVFDEATGRTESPVFADSNAYKLQIDAFVRSIVDGDAVEPDAHDGRAAMRLIDVANRSIAANGAWLSL